jgi:hypothetical protein
MKKLEREVVPSDIFCDIHNDEPVIYYHKREGKLQCSKCASQPMEVVRADFKAIDKTSKRLSKLFIWMTEEPGAEKDADGEGLI